MGRKEDKEKLIFCLNPGIEGPRGREMVNSQFFPLGRSKIGKKIGIIAAAAVVAFLVFKWVTF
jgi:hypothetical protein